VLREPPSSHDFHQSSTVDHRGVEDLPDDFHAVSDLLERLVSDHQLVVKVTDGLLHVHHPATHITYITSPTYPHPDSLFIQDALGYKLTSSPNLTFWATTPNTG